MADIITPFQTYVVLQADTFRETLFGTTGHSGIDLLIHIFAIFGVLGAVVFGIINIDDMLTNKQRAGIIAGAAFACFLSFIMMALSALTPSSKVLAGSFTS